MIKKFFIIRNWQCTRRSKVKPNVTFEIRICKTKRTRNIWKFVKRTPRVKRQRNQTVYPIDTTLTAQNRKKNTSTKTNKNHTFRIPVTLETTSRLPLRQYQKLFKDTIKIRSPDWSRSGARSGAFRCVPARVRDVFRFRAFRRLTKSKE